MCFVLMFYNAVLVTFSSFAITSLKKRELIVVVFSIDFVFLKSGCVSNMCLFLAVPWIGTCMWSVNVVFSGHTHFPGHKVKSCNFGHQVRSESDLVCFIS